MTSKKQWAIGALGLSCAVGCVAYLNRSTTTEVPIVQFQGFEVPDVRDGEAVFYRRFGYAGDSLKVGNNAHINLGDLGWNDDISSFKLGKGIRVELCEHGACYGYWDDKTSYVGPYKTDNFNRWTDETSVLRTYPYNPTDLNEARVQIFAYCGYRAGPAGTFKIGKYDAEKIKAEGVD